MVTGSCKFGIVISKAPIIQNGLGNIIANHFPEYELSYCRALEELTLLQLRRADLVIADLSGDIRHPKSICEQYYKLLTQYLDIHWIFIVPRLLYPLAVEMLLRPESTLLSQVDRSM